MQWMHACSALHPNSSIKCGWLTFNHIRNLRNSHSVGESILLDMPGVNLPRAVNFWQWFQYVLRTGNTLNKLTMSFSLLRGVRTSLIMQLPKPRTSRLNWIKRCWGFTALHSNDTAVQNRWIWTAIPSLQAWLCSASLPHVSPRRPESWGCCKSCVVFGGFVFSR